MLRHSRSGMENIFWVGAADPQANRFCVLQLHGGIMERGGRKGTGLLVQSPQC